MKAAIGRLAALVIVFSALGLGTAPAVLAVVRSCGNTIPTSADSYGNPTGTGYTSDGVGKSAGSVAVTGVRATIVTTPSSFQPCSGASPLTGYRAVYARVMIAPQSGAPTSCPSWSVTGEAEFCNLSLGVIVCSGRNFGQPGNGGCDDSGVPHWVYHAEGCSPFPSPWLSNWHDLGPATPGAHSYTIAMDSSLKWHFQIDGVDKVTHFSKSAAEIGCWSANLTVARWESARFRAGDSIGDPVIPRWTYFQDANYGRFNLGWTATASAPKARHAPVSGFTATARTFRTTPSSVRRVPVAVT